MRIVRTNFVRVASLLVIIAFAAACGGDSNGPNTNALIGVWNATSFSDGTVDIIQQGETVVITFQSNDNYSIEVTNDVAGLCDTGMACTLTGPFSSTSTTVTLDPGTMDEAVLNWTRNGTTLTLSGDIDGTAITVVLQKQ